MYIYAEHTSGAGKRVPDYTIDKYEASGNDPAECDDWFEVEDDNAAEYEEAADHEEKRRPGADMSYYRRIARTLREEAGR